LLGHPAGVYLSYSLREPAPERFYRELRRMALDPLRVETREINLAHRLAQGRDVSRRNQHSGLAVDHGLASSARVGGHDRPACGLRFDSRDAELLDVRHHQSQGTRVELREFRIRDAAKELGAVSVDSMQPLSVRPRSNDLDVPSSAPRGGSPSAASTSGAVPRKTCSWSFVSSRTTAADRSVPALAARSPSVAARSCGTFSPSRLRSRDAGVRLGVRLDPVDHPRRGGHRDVCEARDRREGWGIRFRRVDHNTPAAIRAPTIPSPIMIRKDQYVSGMVGV